MKNVKMLKFEEEQVKLLASIVSTDIMDKIFYQKQSDQAKDKTRKF